MCPCAGDRIVPTFQEQRCSGVIGDTIVLMCWGQDHACALAMGTALRPCAGDRITPVFWGQDHAHIPGTALCPHPRDRIVPLCQGHRHTHHLVTMCWATTPGHQTLPMQGDVSMSPVPPVSPCPPCPRTLALVLDGEAEDVAGAEAGAVIHAAVEERVRVGVLDVEDLPGGGHVPGDALVRRDADLVALRSLSPVTTAVTPCDTVPSSPRSPRRPPRRRQTLWPPARGSAGPAGTRSICKRRGGRWYPRGSHPCHPPSGHGHSHLGVAEVSRLRDDLLEQDGDVVCGGGHGQGAPREVL